MEQSGGVNQFDHRGEAEMMCSTISECAAHHQKQGRTQSLTTCRNDVLRYLGHQRHAGRQAPTDDLVNLLHVLGNEREGGCCGGGVVSQDGGHRKCPDYRKLKEWS
ncbi:hypothetical protein D3C71_1790940 [compost metagenome]